MEFAYQKTGGFMKDILKMDFLMEREELSIIMATCSTVRENKNYFIGDFYKNFTTGLGTFLKNDILYSGEEAKKQMKEIGIDL